MYNVGIIIGLRNNTFVSGRKVDGTIVSLIGVSAGDKVSLDPGGLGVELGGNLRLPASAYANWGVTVGASGYGIRDNAGTIESKNSAGAWAPIAAAAASAGGWTDDGTVVRLDTGTDQVSIGSATPIGANTLSVTGTLETTGAAQFGGLVTVPRTGQAVSIGSTANTTTFYSAVLNSGATQAIFGVDATGAGTGLAGTLTNKTFIIRQNNAEVMNFGATETVLNDLGADRDFRIESDTNVNHYNSDAGAMTGVGSHAFGTTVTSNTYFRIGAPALTQGANNDFYAAMIYPAGAVTIPAGTAAIVASLYVQEPNIVATGTVSDAYTVVITGAPTEGTRNGALWTNGQLRCSGLPTSAAGLPAGSLWNNSGVVNIV